MNPQPQADYYYLSLIKHHENGWSIHGLWPQYDEPKNNKKYPTFCRQVEFDINKIKDLLPELEKKWYSYDGTSIPRDESFWKHEWEKHGSCIVTDIDEHTYFKKTIELFDEAIKRNLPDYYINGNKCLIPVDLDFEFTNEKSEIDKSR
jgi:ribonuclease I